MQSHRPVSESCRRALAASLVELREKQRQIHIHTQRERERERERERGGGGGGRERVVSEPEVDF